VTSRTAFGVPIREAAAAEGGSGEGDRHITSGSPLSGVFHIRARSPFLSFRSLARTLARFLRRRRRRETRASACMQTRFAHNDVVATTGGPETESWLCPRHRKRLDLRLLVPAREKIPSCS